MLPMLLLKVMMLLLMLPMLLLKVMMMAVRQCPVQANEHANA
jgi:hypothetical protein